MWDVKNTEETDLDDLDNLFYLNYVGCKVYNWFIQ